MKKVLIGICLVLLGFIFFRSCSEEEKEKAILKENSMLIQEQLLNVSKLIVTEGHFSEVYNYKDSQELFGPLITAEKKALVVVNAEVTVAYDMSKMEYEIDTETKTVHLLVLPEPEIKMAPDFEYYDVSADYLNPFDAADYNTIKRNVKASLLRKVAASNLKSNAESRLLSELHRLFILTNTMGWTLTYESQVITDFTDAEEGFKKVLDEEYQLKPSHRQ